MPQHPDIRAAIVSRMTQLGLRQRDVVVRSGLTKSHVSMYLSGKRDMTGEYLARIMVAVGLELKTTRPRSV